MKTTIIAIVGPTASGKTKLAIELAKQFGGEIICADSRTIYKDFSIGTAKPTPEEQQGIPHFGLDLVEPNHRFSAYEFKKYADQKIAEISARGNLPILVGGTGLYMDAVLFDYMFRGRDSGESFDEYNDSDLVALARARYPKDVVHIDTKNRQRVEQLLTRGPSPKRDTVSLAYHALILGMNPGMETLRTRIPARIDDMLKHGFLDEVRQLRARYGHDCPQLTIIGYRYMSAHLDGTLTLEQAKEAFARADLALAKRQLTWFARNPHIHWTSADSHKASELVAQFVHAN